MLERTCENAGRERGDPDASRVEGLHEVDEAVPFLAEQILDGNFDILHDQLGRVRGAPTELVLLLAGAESFHSRQARFVADADLLRDLDVARFLREYKGADAARALRSIGNSGDDEDLADASVRDEALDAVENVVVALSNRCRA